MTSDPAHRALAVLSALICAWQLYASPRVKGKYTNQKYAFSVQVPAGTFGYMSPAPAPNHGVAIFLDAKKRDDTKDPAVFIDGFFDAEGLASAEKLAAQMASSFASENHLAVVRDARSRLADLDAREVILRGTNSPGNINYIHLLVGYRPIPGSEVGIYYMVWLQSRSDDPQMEATYDAVVRSFALVPIP